MAGVVADRGVVKLFTCDGNGVQGLLDVSLISPSMF